MDDGSQQAGDDAENGPNRRAFLAVTSSSIATIAGCTESGEIEINASVESGEGSSDAGDNDGTDEDGEAETGEDDRNRETDESDNGDETTESPTIRQYIALQDTLGESLVALSEANGVLAEKRSKLVTMIYGVIATNRQDRFQQLPLPDGFDREATFDPKPGVVRDLRGSEFVDYAPESRQEFEAAVREHEEQKTITENLRSEVAANVNEVRLFLEENEETFALENEGTTSIEVHPRFADEPLRLLDSVWLVSTQVQGIDGEVLGPFEGVVESMTAELFESEDTSDTDSCPEAGTWQCTDASASIRVSKGADFNPFGHAWLEHTKQYKFVDENCEDITTFPLTPRLVREEWGFYGVRMQDDSDNDTWCERDVWSGDCDADEYRAFEALIDEITDRPGNAIPIPWAPHYNCLDWALDMLAVLDEDRTDELEDEAEGDWTNLRYPKNLCE